MAHCHIQLCRMADLRQIRQHIAEHAELLVHIVARKTLQRLSQPEGIAILCVLQQRTKSVDAIGFDVFIRVLALRNGEHPRLAAGIFDEADALERRAYTGVVPVKRGDEVVGVAHEQLHLILCERRSQRSDNIRQSRLVTGDDIHVALDDDHLIGCADR